MEESETFPDSGNLARKVIAIAAGEAHTLALTGDGRVYAWGRGMFGRLGNGSESDEQFPVRVKFGDSGKSEYEKLKFVGVAAGAYHSLALADDGSVWCWGYNSYGQLGFSGDNSVVPHLMEQFLALGSPGSLADESKTNQKAPIKVCFVKAGGMMSLAIDNLGALWMWGNFPQQSSSSTEDHGFSLVSSYIPTPVWDLHGHIVVKVACGNEHVVALVSAGETYKGEDLVCYSWGSNNHGQLGVGDRESRLRPEIIETFNQDLAWAVYELACGSFHTALLTHKKRPNDTLESMCWTFGLGENTLESMCWTFGLGENGQLGHGTTQSALVPGQVNELPQNVFLISVDCGLFHTSVVSSAGDVWSWGMEKGLGLCPNASLTVNESGDAVSPILISKFQNPVQVACGAAHTVLVTDDGYKLWSWGRGRSGVLGTGKTIDFFAPGIVLWPLLTEEFTQEELNTGGSEEDKIKPKNLEEAAETDEKLSLAMEEMIGNDGISGSQ